MNYPYLAFYLGLVLITMTNGRQFLQASKELSDQWDLMRIEEDLAIDVWMADVSHYVFKISNELVLKVKGYKNLLF